MDEGYVIYIVLKLLRCSVAIGFFMVFAIIIANVIRTASHGNPWLASLTKRKELITSEYVWRKVKEKYRTLRENARKRRAYITRVLEQEGITQRATIRFYQIWRFYRMVRRTYFFYFLEGLALLIVYWIFNKKWVVLQHLVQLFQWVFLVWFYI